MMIAFIIAIIMLAFGMNMASLPTFLQDGVGRLSLLMTPMVLLFIGISVRIDWKQFRQIGMLLVFRSACAFLISALILAVLPASVSAALLIVIVAFPQSAASFWPFAHLSAVNDAEEGKKKTFNTDFALNILALSLPFSTVIILCICSMQSFFLSSVHLLLIGLALMVLAMLPRLILSIKGVKKKTTIEVARVKHN